MNAFDRMTENADAISSLMPILDWRIHPLTGLLFLLLAPALIAGIIRVTAMYVQRSERRRDEDMRDPRNGGTAA